MPQDTATTCPPNADLERLVRGRLTEARAAALCEHIGACPGCQERLDALTGNCDELACTLRECTKDTPPPNDSAYHRALADAEAEVHTTSLFRNGSADTPASTDTPPAGDLSLDFLQPTDEPGHLGKLGEFGIIRIVGRGGMGVVLHGYDPCLARDVAVKVIDPLLADNEVARQRFCREARAAAAVTHDNLVAVHQVNEDEASGLPYLVMQLVNGESLEQRLKRDKTLTAMEVARLGMQAAAGLAAAHAGGLIHRDIKPANILLEAPSDRVKLTDFGLARAVEDVKLTRPGFVAGSPLYMAPEQARGDDVDHRADLFSLGSVLYEAAAGAPAFDAKTPLAVLRRVADETPRPLHEVSPELPVWLSEIVDKLLAKNPDDRYQTAAEVAEEFAGVLAREHALSPLDVPAEICPSATRSAMARARKPICWKSVAFRVTPWLGGMVIGALLGVLLWPRDVVEKIVEVPVVPAFDPGPLPKMTLKADAGTVWAVAFLGADRLVVGMDDGRVKIWNWMSGQEIKTLPRQGGTIWAADVSPNGKRLVTTCDDAYVRVWDLERGEVVRSYSQSASTKAAVFHPDGLKVATGDRNSIIRIWDFDSEIPIQLKGHLGTVHSLAFSPNGEKLASAGSDGTVKVWKWMEPDKDPVTLEQHRGAVYGVAFSPDGKTLASTGWDGTVRIWDVEKSELIKTIQAYEGDAWSVSFGGNGKWIASAGQDAVKVWEVETGKEIFTYRSPRAFHTVRFAKDGVTLAAGGRDGSVRVWEIGK